MNDGIKVTGIDLVKFAQSVYALSAPKGLGFIHFQGGGLSAAEARKFIEHDGNCVLSMDYVNGRACKMQVFKDGDDIYICRAWYDHTDAQLRNLLAQFNLSIPTPEAHLSACECAECKKKKSTS